MKTNHWINVAVKNVIPLFLLPEYYYIIYKFYRGLKYHTIYNFLEIRQYVINQ